MHNKLCSVLLIRTPYKHFPIGKAPLHGPKRHAFIFLPLSLFLFFFFFFFLAPSSSLLSFNSSSSTSTTALSLSSCLLIGARGSILQARVVVILLFGPPSNPTAVTSTAGMMRLSSPIREMVFIIMSLFFSYVEY